MQNKKYNFLGAIRQTMPIRNNENKIKTVFIRALLAGKSLKKASVSYFLNFGLMIVTPWLVNRGFFEVKSVSRRLILSPAKNYY